MRRVVVAVLVLVAASILAACGDDDDDGGGASVTPAQYAREANAACTRVTEELARTFEGGSFPVVKSQVPAFVDQIAPTITREMNALYEIEPPEGEEARLRGFRDAARAQGARFQRAAADDAEAARVFQEEGGWEPLRTAAKAYGGLSACERIDEESEEDDAQQKVDIATLPAEKRAYVDRIDAICRSSQAEDQKVEEEIFGEGFPPEISKWAEGLPRFAEIGRRHLAQIGQVRPPASEKATVDALIAEQEQILADTDKAAAAAKAGDEPTLISVLQGVFPKFEALDAKLRQFGFQVCGSEPEEAEGGE